MTPEPTTGTPMTEAEEAKSRRSVAMLGEGGEWSPLQWSNRTAMRLLATLDIERQAAAQHDADLRRAVEGMFGWEKRSADSISRAAVLALFDAAPDAPGLDVEARRGPTASTSVERPDGSPDRLRGGDADGTSGHRGASPTLDVLGQAGRLGSVLRAPDGRWYVGTADLAEHPSFATAGAAADYLAARLSTEPRPLNDIEVRDA